MNYPNLNVRLLVRTRTRVWDCDVHDGVVQVTTIRCDLIAQETEGEKNVNATVRHNNCK